MDRQTQHLVRNQFTDKFTATRAGEKHAVLISNNSLPNYTGKRLLSLAEKLRMNCQS